MTRFIFSSKDEFLRWFNEHASNDRSEVYCIVSSKELLVYPRRTSRPISYAYIKLDSDDEFTKLYKYFEEKRFKVYFVDKVDWDDTKPVF